MDMKRVKVCIRCANFSMRELRAKAEETGCELKLGCIGQCSGRCPELSDKYFGRIGNEVVICDTKEEFFERMK